MIRVLLVDDQTLIRQGIAMLLELEPDLEVVGAVGDGRAAIEAVEKLRPDVVLMDVRMPGMDGVTATRELNRRFPEVGVIILTTFDDDEYVFEGLKAGARGYLLKDISSEEMAEAVRTVARGEALIQPSIARKVVAEFSRLAVGTSPAPERMPPRSPNALTERELDVLKALARGMSNKEIAAALVITEGTVKTHISNILAKLEVRDRTQAVLKAQQLRLLDEG
ncbi:MAG: response regulator transcription factor [Roseiflexus sp.]|nr:response regulator transcription factor [Roseiflexus sp.]MCS7289415.1 response regulator transcription factor [Roseiflexus sp.]MDW8144881.1 response regulator transcription factor [Roseiflexaceae bacterium]MDW8233765.1 response regulator transcription factor [Roseiflexaceae bacterium]